MLSNFGNNDSKKEDRGKATKKSQSLCTYSTRRNESRDCMRCSVRIQGFRGNWGSKGNFQNSAFSIGLMKTFIYVLVVDVAILLKNSKAEVTKTMRRIPADKKNPGFQRRKSESLASLKTAILPFRRAKSTVHWVQDTLLIPVISQFSFKSIRFGSFREDIREKVKCTGFADKYDRIQIIFIYFQNQTMLIRRWYYQHLYSPDAMNIIQQTLPQSSQGIRTIYASCSLNILRVLFWK